MKLLQSVCVIKLMHVASLFYLFFFIAFATSLSAHGPGHQHANRSNTQAFIANDFSIANTRQSSAHDQGSSNSKVIDEKVDERIWGASLMGGWESRHVHYGVNESGKNSVHFYEAAARIYDVYLSTWAGFALGNEFQEWDFTASYKLELGPVFFLPGYNFRIHPNANHDDHHDHHAHHHSGHEMDDHGSNGAHVHIRYNHELFIVLGTTSIPYVTPSVNFLWDLYENGGGFIELRLDGNLPIYKEKLSLRPYTLLGVNLGYNTRDSLGLNNYQLGLQTIFSFNSNIALFAGINYSVALPVLHTIDQGNAVWVDTGILLSF